MGGRSKHELHRLGHQRTDAHEPQCQQHPLVANPCQRGLGFGGGVHQHQALVLVNFGGTGAEILHLAQEIQDAVQERFSIALEIEPQIYGLPE